MRIGVYGDVHLNKNMRSFQDLWNATAMKSLHHMYNHFDELDVEMVVCLGDFFDTPRLEAKDVGLVLPILEDINSRSYPTYILLGNHEIYDADHNILDYLSIYENIHPVTSTTIMENMCFIPYHEDPKVTDMTDMIVFTHHDIYGSALAGGKTSAFFGLDPAIFSRAKLVMNGHVHLKSRISNRLINAGSLLVSQQGELKLGEYPSYYLVDSHTGVFLEYVNKHSMIYLTISEDEAGKIVQNYDQMHCVLKVEYKDEMPGTWINTAHTSWHKKISSIESSSTEVIHHSSFDMKNYLVDYIKRSADISDSKKSDYTTTGLELLQ